MFGSAFRDRTVWLSGHTGFKGSWLATWLLKSGAKVHGYALEPPTQPSLFDQLGLTSRLSSHQIADVRDADAVEDSIHALRPDFVFHLAAQPIVRLSYQQPRETYQTNVMGTVHVLEALRKLSRPCHAVFVTTDKVYENREASQAHREDDLLGGYDPYSSSKAAAEIAIASYRRSFFSPNESLISIASARAGNVIGGGDWAPDRIVPDSIRALQRGETIPVRNKNSTRPWQHVLEPLSGYLTLAAALANKNVAACSAFNFGPDPEANRSVEEVVRGILTRWPGEWSDGSEPNAPHEAGRLNLAIEKASRLLAWSPLWNFEQTIERTVEWYQRARNGNAAAVTLEQITRYETDWNERSQRN